MSHFVTSADGTRIGYQRHGEGPGVVLIDAAFQYRAGHPPITELATALAGHGLSAVAYDRRGRGESDDVGAAPGAAVDRETEDIAALVEVLGGSATLFGYSSGAALALHAATTLGAAVTALVLYEAPLSLPAQGDNGAWLTELRERQAAGDAEGVVTHYLKDLPPEWLAGAQQSPYWSGMVAMAPTLLYDAEALRRADERPWADQWGDLATPTLVLIGQQCLPLFPPVADALVATLPHAVTERFPGADHGWSPELLADRIALFVA